MTEGHQATLKSFMPSKKQELLGNPAMLGFKLLYLVVGYSLVNVSLSSQNFIFESNQASHE